MIFEEYVAERGQDLLRLAYVLTSDAHLAQDLTQTALSDAYKHWSKVDVAANRDAYVRRMMINSLLGWRRRRSWSERPVAVIPDERVEADPAIAVAASDQTRRLLATLAPRARTVLVLRYYADLDDATIADLMGVSASAVRATASRALGLLRHVEGTDAVKEER